MNKTITQQPSIFEPNLITVFLNDKDGQTKIGEINQIEEHQFYALRTLDGRKLTTINKGKALEFIINQKQTRTINQINLF
jgi:hypothetical protein